MFELIAANLQANFVAKVMLKGYYIYIIINERDGGCYAKYKAYIGT
jgi:hypothetical protein